MASISAPGRAVDLRARAGRRFDWWLLLSSLILMAAGLMSLYSISAAHSEAHFRKQLMNAAIGILPFAIFLVVRPAFWRRISGALYVGSLGLLGLVLAMGSWKGGAKRWIEIGPLQFQPSEAAKLLLVITLAAFWANRQEIAHRFSTFALSLLHVAIPIAMVLKQPHLGGALVLFIIWLSTAIVSGTRLRYLLGAFVLTLALLIGAWSIPGVLRPYHKERVAAMFVADEQDADYQVARAQIAFGVGGVSGSGFLRGQQKEQGYIPEQHNDFILTVVGEEAGLVGGVLLLMAYGFFFFRIWLVMLRADDPYHRMIAAGILGLLSFHTIVNMGMVLQLLPVVGLWLPFMSYGGTALWLCMACVGLLLNLRLREKALLF